MEQFQCVNCGNQTSASETSRCEFCNYPLPIQIEEPPSPEVPSDDDRTQLVEVSPSAAMGATEKVSFIHHRNSNPDKQDVKVLGGWFIMHSKGQPAMTYDLFLGDNVIGRKSSKQDVDVPIENGDVYISRKHGLIKVMRDYNNQLSVEISDVGSLNGIFINGSSRRLPPSEQYQLSSGDSVQIGETVFVFKSIYENVNTRQAVTEVLQSNYTTVIPIGKSY